MSSLQADEVSKTFQKNLIRNCYTYNWVQ